MVKSRSRKVRITTSVAAEVAKKLAATARARKVSKSWLMARAIEAYVNGDANDPGSENTHPAGTKS